MGQRSQIFVRFEKNPGEKEIVARYYIWRKTRINRMSEIYGQKLLPSF